MPTSSVPVDLPAARWSTSPVVDYEPAPESLDQPRSAATRGHSTHRRTPRPRRLPPTPGEPPPPRTAVVFAETALRQVIEVIDRRRPVAQLRPLMTPILVDRVINHADSARRGSATLRRVRVRCVDTGADSDDGHGRMNVTAAEIFASFLRCGRVHALAGRIERHRETWRIVALQIG